MEATELTWCARHCFRLPCPVCQDRAAIRALAEYVTAWGAHDDITKYRVGEDHAIAIERALKEELDKTSLEGLSS